MPFSLSTVALLCENNIRSAWPRDWDQASVEGSKLISAFAKAFSDSFATTMKASVINGGVINGGASAPGGPVVGAILNIPAGGLVSTAPKFKQAFICPNFVVDANGVQKNGAYSAWMKAVVEHIDSNLAIQWSLWIKTWMLSTGEAHGGIAAWVPPPSASPGPWTLGTITPFIFIGQGSNSSLAIDNLSNITVNSGKAKTAYVVLGGEVVGNVAVADTNSKMLVESATKGISKTINDVFKQVMVKDPTNASALGTAVPTTGTIVNGSISGLVFDVT